MSGDHGIEWALVLLLIAVGGVVLASFFVSLPLHGFANGLA